MVYIKYSGVISSITLVLHLLQEDLPEEVLIMKGSNILLEVLLAASLLIVVVTATSVSKLEALDNFENNEALHNVSLS